MKKTLRHILYLGLRPPESLKKEGHHILHYPIIRIIPRPHSSAEIRQAFDKLTDYTHLLFTSKTGVDLFFTYLPILHAPHTEVNKKTIIAVGKATAAELLKYNVFAHIIPIQETAEGIIEELKKQDLRKSYFFWPHSALSRSVLTDYFKKEGIRYCDCILYDTVENGEDPKPDLSIIDEIIFTSPSTVDAYLNIFGSIPKDKTITPIGEVTAQHLKKIATERLDISVIR